MVSCAGDEHTAGLLSDLLVVLCLQLLAETQSVNIHAKVALSSLQDLNAVVYEGWRRIEHQRTAIPSVTLGLLFFLWF